MSQNTLRKQERLALSQHDSVARERIVPFPIQPVVESEQEESSVVQGGAPSTEGIHQILFNLGVEPSLTIREAAGVLRWSCSKARRYFRKVEGICICYQPKRFKRAYRTFTIPVSVFAREWQKMTGQQPKTGQIIRERLVSCVK